MSDYPEKGELYIIFEVKGIAFAVPVSETLGVMKGTADTANVVLPNMRNFVKCIIDSNGLFVTVVNILGDHGDMPIAGNSIVILKRAGHNIGIIANEVHMVNVSTQKILENRITGMKAFTYNNKTYSVLDTNQLYKELEI